MTSESNYKKYRGKCKQFVYEAVKNDPTLKAVRGFFHCVFDGKQAHWWCIRQDGSIFDPTVKQFKGGGVCGEYEEFDGTMPCAECGRKIQEAEFIMLGNGNYVVCSNKCACKFLGCDY